MRLIAQPPKASHEPTYIRLKRHQSTTFLILDEAKPTSKSIRKALVKAFNDCPGNASFLALGPDTGEKLDADHIVLGVEDEAGKGLTPTYSELNEDQVVTEKALVWRTKDEQFQVDEYPENEEDE